MKANELMIGDWVLFKETPQQILEISGIDNEVYLGTVLLAHHQSEIQPIPLTPEILEKNGFEDIGDDTYQLEEKPCWFWVDFFRHNYGCEYDTSTYEYEDSEHRLKLYGIPSVHQLQHALRLCGIDKTIEL